ncbi:hypothetical protein [Streptomyces resistomycificus]|nr:hypothetical protein [Streptomyces resistomycificus]
MVVLALTGFSSGRGQGNSSKESSDGGGCSSSSQDHGSSTRGGRDPLGSSSSGSRSSESHGSGTSTNDRGGSSQPTPTASSSTAQPLKDGTAVLVQCATTEDPYATVEIRNPNGRDALFTVKVNFKDEHGYPLFDTGDQVSVPAKDKTTYRVAVASSGRVGMIERCEVDPRAAAVR